MTPLTKITLLLIISFIVIIYTVVRTKNSNLNSDTKTLLYIFAVLMPIIGLILFFIMNRKNSQVPAR